MSLRHGDLAYVSLWLPDAEHASRFFGEVLGWRFAPGSSPRGLQVQGLSIHHGLWSSPRSTLFLCFVVEDLLSATAEVVKAGGTADEPHLQPSGLISECADDHGEPFALFEVGSHADGGESDSESESKSESDSERRARANGSISGDLAYVTMEVVDSARARDFYGSVLGWSFASGGAEDGWQVEDCVPMVGLSGGHDRATNVPMYRVNDIVPAVEKVRSLGGTCTDPTQQPYGVTARCTYDQGTRFYLGCLHES